MKLYHLSSGPLRVNSYFLVNEDTLDAVVIDSGENYNKIKETEQKYGFKIKAVLLTHAHFDHSGNAKKLQDDGAKVYISIIDAPKLYNGGTLSEDFGRKFNNVVPDFTFSDNEDLDICGIKIHTILTPGHTDGSATFVVDNYLFTGDTLFFECVGRTDFPTGDLETLINSVRKLYALNGDYKVLPGHQEFSTLEHERQFNYFREYD